MPCSPVGHYCASQTKTPCAADQFNKLLGQDAMGDCTTCPAGVSPRYTSLAGAYSCTIPYVRIDCAGAWLHS